MIPVTEKGLTLGGGNLCGHAMGILHGGMPSSGGDHITCSPYFMAQSCTLSL